MSRSILVVGAGKSTSYLLDYFLEKSGEEDLKVIIGDKNPDGVPEALHRHPNAEVIPLDITDANSRKARVM